MKVLVAYFTASGITRHAANLIAKTLGCDSYEIEPEVPYSANDLNWNDKNSRSSREMANPHLRPLIKIPNLDLNQYETIILGFPIWWYIAPTIINSFLEKLNLDHKTIILFATSGGSGFAKTRESLIPSISKTTIIKEGIVFKNGSSDESIVNWALSIKL